MSESRNILHQDTLSVSLSSQVHNPIKAKANGGNIWRHPVEHMLRGRIFWGRYTLSLSISPPPFAIPNSSTTLSSLSSPPMADQNPEINGSETNEPSPKIQKLEQNGVRGTPNSVTNQFLKVKKLSEKAVLPSRASPLSAGYDLSR